MFTAEFVGWLSAFGLVSLAIAVPNMLFRSKDPPSGRLSDPWFRWLFWAAPYLFWGGLASLLVGLLIGLVTD